MKVQPLISNKGTKKAIQRWIYILLNALFASILVTIGPALQSAKATVLTCAQGGACVIGDTGPGGGKVFYADVTPNGFDEHYASCSPHCHYLEAAPTVGDRRWPEPTLFWSPNTFGIIGTETSLGTGYANTLKMVADTIGSNPGNYAASSHSFAGPNLLTDWFLPSKDELAQLYYHRSAIDPLMIAGQYWSSSEFPGSSYPYFLDLRYADQGLMDGYGFGSNPKNTQYYVRPIRAFASTTAAPVIISPPSNTIISGTVGVPLTYTFSLSGTAPFEVRASKALPAGLTMTLGGTISGTPTAAGTTTLSFEVIDSNLGPASYVTGISFVIDLPSSPTPAFAISSRDETATVGTAITGYTITSSGGTVASYSITPDISVTPRNGISFNTTTGLISGTPTAAAARVTYTITGTNSGGSASRTFSLLVHTFACTGGGYDVTGGVASNGSSCSGSLTLDSSVTSIASSGFETSTITSLTIPDSVVTIGASAFLQDSNLSVLHLGSGVTSIGSSAFSFANITSLVVPNSVISIGDNAFYASHLTSLTLGSGLNTIGVNAFAENTLDCRGFRNLSSANLIPSVLEYASSCQAVVISPTNNQIIRGKVGTPLIFYIEASYGGPVQTSMIGSLPAGLTLSSPGMISGTPTAAGTTTLTFTIQDGRLLPATTVSGVQFVIESTTEAVALPLTPDPVQQSKITSLAPAAAIAGVPTQVEITGSFVEKIRAIQINGVALPIDSWKQTTTTISFTMPGKSAGSYQIQLYNGSAPVLKAQSFTFTAPITVAAPTPTPTAKPKVTYIRCAKANRGTKVVYGVNPTCPTGYIKK